MTKFTVNIEIDIEAMDDMDPREVREFLTERFQSDITWIGPECNFDRFKYIGVTRTIPTDPSDHSRHRMAY